MKNLLTATLPALALLALGGCATSGALTTSTETDGVYYSSSDRTTAAASPAPIGYGSQGTIPARALDDTTPVAAATTDDANPDYQGGTTQGGYATGSDYYSNSYNNGLSYYNPSGFNQPYAGPGVSSYNYSPVYGASPSYYGSPFGYSSAFGYGYSPYGFGYSPFMSYGYSPFGYGGGFYDPFYSPFGYGYGSGLSIGFGYGFGGFGGFGSPYGYGYSPFGYGGYPYGYASGYGRGYGYGGYGYGNEYARPVIYTRGAGVSSPGAGAVLYGSRSNRGGAVMNPGSNAIGNPNAVNMGGRPSGSYTGNAVAIPGSNMSNNGMPAAGPRGRGGRAVTFGDATGQPSYSTPGTQVNAAPNATSNAAPSSGGRRGFFGGFFGNGNPNANAAGQPATAGQPANTGSYGGRQRAYSNYGQGQSQQPMQQRSYSQPQRSFSQPSYSQPSPSRSFGGGSFGGGGGGGSFGGGGGGGGGRGRR